jgi:hypothetical protein
VSDRPHADAVNHLDASTKRMYADAQAIGALAIAHAILDLSDAIRGDHE